MIGLDTNVLVRYLAQDEAKQAAIATRLIERELSAAQPGYISLIVLIELCWVLRRLYMVTENELHATIQDVLNTAQFHVQLRTVVQQAVQQRSTSVNTRTTLPDTLIALLAQHEGCTYTVTFDKAAVKSAGMTLLV